MNARLSSLLVAGGVVLAGIQSGSLNGALPEALSVATLEAAAIQPGGAQVVKLAIPGFSGLPRLQVLANPARVVVDLPGVNRGDRVSKKDVQGLSGPQIIRSRMAQFALAPQPVTRVIEEMLIAKKGDGLNGWAEVLQRFGDPEPQCGLPFGIRPRLFIHRRCGRLVETLPALQHDPNRPEDVLKVDADEDGVGGDDAADALRYLVATKARAVSQRKLRGL